MAVLPALILVYFLQQLDKSSLSYTAVFNIVDETHLIGSQYSWLSSIVYVAQLVFQPLSSYAIVRLPVGKWVFINIFCWGIVVASSSAAKNFAGLVTARLLLGIFEASIGAIHSLPKMSLHSTSHSAFIHCNHPDVVAPKGTNVPNSGMERQQWCLWGGEYSLVFLP